VIRSPGRGAPRAFIAALALAAAATPARAGPTGKALPGLQAYDALMTGLLRKWDIAGGSLALARDGRLLLARGYGYADVEGKRPVEPESLFRLASLSKTVTAVAVLQLAQAGRLGLDDRVLPLLGELGPRPERIADPRVRDITVRHLLQHSGGFNRAQSRDPVFLPRAAEAARRQGGRLPPDCPAILRDTLERKLDFAPGAYYAYSNVGYCILGRVIERASGIGYEQFVRERILSPAGATGMRLGRTLEAAPAEVRYYEYRGATPVKAMPGLGLKQAPRPYGAFAVETMDAYGGWIGAPTQYLRFLLAIDGRRGVALLERRMIVEMNAYPGLQGAPGEDEEKLAGPVYYGLGINARALRGGVNLWHGGSLDGTSALAVRTADGFAWVAVFNGRPRDRGAFRGELERGLWEAKRSVRKWPEGDLFGARP
jgi:CubicO group peptidase (beta-lactamase class C family)